MDKNIYACDAHLDKAFDHFLDENEIFPYLEKIQREIKCSYCDNPAVYVLKAKQENS